ncbi:MAG: hypothetical protein ABI181_11720 [Mycobacteriaceae bacterium]
MTSAGVVRSWSDDDGWGVIDAPEVPGGCWTHFSNVDGAELPSLAPGQRVNLEWETPGQDGCAFRAVRVWAEGSEPVTREPSPPSSAYRSTLTTTVDEAAAGADDQRG